MMNLSTCIVILNIFHISVSKSCVEINPRPIDSEWEHELQKDLKKCYKVRIAPSNTTVVEIKILMKSFTIDSDDGSFNMYSWTMLSWTDERLKWNSKDYYDITDTYTSSYDNWAPIVVQKNVGEEDYYRYSGKCKISFNGRVACHSRVENKARCTAYMRNWPYDTLNCSMSLGITYQKSNITLLPRSNKTVSMMGAEYGAEWIITGYNEVYTPNESVQITVTFTLERTAEGLRAVIIYPSVLIAILTVVTMFKDVNKFTRFWLSCFAVLCHLFFLNIISDIIPRYGTETPKIVMFHRSSLLLSSFLMMIAFGLKGLRNREKVANTRIRFVNRFVFESYGKHVIWPRWETKKGIVTPDSVDLEDVEAWNDFGNILNTLCWVVCAIVYLILYFVYVPQPPPLTF